MRPSAQFAAGVRPEPATHLDRAVMRATRGMIYGTGGAAARLGLKPQTLQRKMRKLGIQRAPFV